MPISDFIRQLFAQEDAKQENYNRPLPAREARSRRDHDLFLKRLNEVLWEQRTILAGNVHLVGLQKVKTIAGEKWPRMATRAQEVATAVIQKLCQPGDLHTQYDDLSFLIVFSDLSLHQAELRCHEIGEEIGRRLLGEDYGPAASQVLAGVFETDGAIVFNATDKQDLLRRLTHAAEGQAAEQAADDSMDASPDFSFANLDREKALASMHVRYRPMWNLRHQAIANYFSTAGAVNVFGEQIWDTALRDDYAEALSTADFDMFVAQKALSDLASLVRQGHKVLLCWPIHFETIAVRASRQAFTDLCRGIPDTLRELLILELDGLPEGAPQSRLVEILSILRPFCRGQIVRVPHTFRQFEKMAGIGVNGVGFDLSAVQRGDAVRIKALNDFVAAAAKHGLKTYAHGLNSRSQALAALVAGYEWVNGAAVEDLVEAPTQMRRFGLNDLYRELR